MATRLTIRTELKQRLGDTAGAIWTDANLNGYIENAIRGLYPTFFRRDAATTTATAGPMQTMPAGARNLYEVALQTSGSVRPVPILGWAEGSGSTFVPVTGITGSTLVWAWTKGFTAPTADGTTLDTNEDAEEVLIIRSHIAAIEHLLSNRVKRDKYFAINLRQATSEPDLGLTLDALHGSLDERVKRAVPLPDVRR